jgi:hypothetical protein
LGAEPARFYRSTRCVGARKEVQNHSFPAQAFQGDFVSILVRQIELGRFIMDIHGNPSRKIELECCNAG